MPIARYLGLADVVVFSCETARFNYSCPVFIKCWPSMLTFVLMRGPGALENAFAILVLAGAKLFAADMLTLPVSYRDRLFMISVLTL